MPTFQQIYSQYSSARDKNLIGPDESISDYAKKALAFTGDPSYQSVAEGGTVGNWVRQRSADLTGLVNSGPVDEWTSEAVGQVGDLFGITPDASRSMGARLPRMVVDFLPMMAAAPFTGGASLLPALGMGATSALSAASAYEDTGEVGSAIIGGAAPYLGTALAQRGGQAALGLAARSPALQKLGFTGGTKYVNAALSEAERASLAASGNLTAEAIAGATVNKTVVEKLADKGLGYLGGQLAANAGFFGIDTAYHGPSTTFNRDYLFNSLVGNVAFGLADIPRAFRPNVLPGSQKFNLPEAPKVYNSPGEQRAVEAAAMFQDLKDPVAFEQQRKKYGLDIADISMKTEELAAALNAKEIGLRVNETDFISKWNNYVTNTPEAQAAQFPTIKRGGAFGSELLGMKEVLGMQSLPIKAQEIVAGFKKQNNQLKAQVDGVVKNLGSPVKYTESLKVAVEKLNLDEFLQTPLEERDYATALKGSWVSLDGADLVRDIHRKDAGLEPLRPDLYQEFVNLFKGEPATFTPDKHMELLVAASLARGKTPKFAEAKKKSQEAVEEGQPDEVVVKEALKGMEEENKEVLAAFRQPVIPEDLQSGLEDTGGLPPVDLIAGLAKKPAVASVSPRQTPVAEANPVVEQAPRVQQTISERLIASIPAKWDRVRDVVADFYRTGDDTQLQNIGIDEASMRIKTIATRNLEAADPAYKQRNAEWDKAQKTAEAERQKILNTLPVKNETLTPDMQAVLKNNRVDQQRIPTEFLRAEDWSRVKDQDGNEYLIPVPDGEFQRAEDFAKTLMKEHVGPEMLPESSKQLVSLAKMLGNPELWYAKLKEMVKGMSDALFARASAGAFDFGMREVQNGKLIRPGKPPLGTKDGWMTELEFRVNGGDLGPLQKDEVAFYKQLVPEAFAGDKVHLQKLWDGLGKVGEQVKVVTYGQDGQVSEAKQQFDRLVHDWFDNLTSAQRYAVSSYDTNDREVSVQHSLDLAKIRQYRELRESVGNERGTGPRATSHYNQISPFDTKKFPVLRVDVVLPEGKVSAEMDRRVRTGERVSGADFMAAEKDTLWKQDNLHENLPNTLGWAMVQIVPHPTVVGKKVAFIAELQSRWSQERSRYSIVESSEPGVYSVWRKETGGGKFELHRGLTSKADAQQLIDKAVPPHATLPIHQSLVAKAVIKHFKEANAKAVAEGRLDDVVDFVGVSDGETAMMTEGHDKRANIKGFKSKEEAEDNAPGSWDKTVQEKDGTWTLEGVEDLRNKTAFDKLRAQGYRVETPQEGGMRLAYDTTLPSIVSKLAGEGRMEDFGLHKNAIQGNARENPMETRTFPTIDEAENFLSQQPGELNHGSIRRVDNGFEVNTPKIGSPVFREVDPITGELVPKTRIKARVFDISNPSERVNTLFAQNAGKIFGAASYNQKKIFINSEAFNSLNPAEKLGFIFAHEHAHISFAKALDGSYGPEARALAETAQRWVMTADPQAKQVVRDVLMDLHLPKELRDADGIREVLNNDDPNEWLANAMALYAGGAIKASKPKMAFAMLPKPVRNFFEWAIQGMQNLYKGAKTWMKLGGDKEKLAQVSTIKDLMDTIRRSYRQAEWDASEAEAFLRVQPEDMIEKATDLQFAKVSPSARTGGAVFKEEPVKWMKGVFDAWNNPLHTLARLHKAFVEPVLSVHQKHDRITNGIMEVEKTFFGGLSASGKVQIDSKAHERVFGSMPLKTLLNDIQRFAVQENKRVIQEGATPNTLEVNLGNLSPELRGKLAQFKPEAQQALVHVLASFEMANRKSQEIFKTGFLRESTARLAQMMQFKSSFNKADFGKTPEIAKGIMNDLLNGDPVLARSKLDMMDSMEADKLIESAQLLAQQHVKLAEYYAKHPSYMSFRRFKKHKQRMEKPGVADDVVDADTPGELQKVVAEQVAKGWKPKGDPMVQDKKSKEQYRMNDELLQLIRQHDSEMLESMKTQGLTADQFDSLASMLNTEDLVARQINAKELYKPMGLRKFSGDLERFDALEQFMRYTPAAIHAVESRATEAEVNFWMQNPELKDLQSEKDQFKALYEQSKTPDPEWARKLAKANAVWHIGWNLPGHIAETAQPFLSHLPELIARGDGTVKGLARILRAEKEMLNVQRVRTKGVFSKDKVAKFEHAGEKFEGIPAAWLQANGTKGDNLEIARALEALSNRIQRAPMSEILNSFDSKNHTNLERLSRGEPLAKAIDFIKKPFNMYVKGSMTFYSQFPMHNAVVAIVSSYRQAREQGFSPKDAIAKAELFDLSVNNSSGRLERPEMFNKLGGAGHLVYQLSSYVRGRFADLATFYRHGWSDDQYNLTPAEKKNARKAFQTMILAQVGAAGLLGMPFVGAGIALMEELLGEDIKGRMYEALDEVTEDPSLTRALTHGFASAFAESLGIPADMHSRFALSGFLGTNAYDGMSAKSFMGPSVAMLDSLWKLGGTMAQGKSVEEALTVGGPGGVKRLAEALSEDFQRDNPEASLAWSALGFRSTQMTKRKEFNRIVDRREMESRRELELAANRISDTLANPATARKTLFDEAMKLVPSGLNPLEQKQQLQQNIKDLAAKVSLLEANKVAPEDVRTQVPGRVAPQVANVGRSMGVQMNDPMELARSLATQKTRSVLGQPLSQRPVRNAMMRDLQWGANPWEF